MLNLIHFFIPSQWIYIFLKLFLLFIFTYLIHFEKGIFKDTVHLQHTESRGCHPHRSARAGFCTFSKAWILFAVSLGRLLLFRVWRQWPSQPVQCGGTKHHTSLSWLHWGSLDEASGSGRQREAGRATGAHCHLSLCICNTLKLYPKLNIHEMAKA